MGIWWSCSKRGSLSIILSLHLLIPSPRLQYILSLATEVNAEPLPAVPEVFGVRLPQISECLTSVDFDLVPTKPPPGVKLYEEEINEIEESESSEEEVDEDEDADMEVAVIAKGPGVGTPLSSSQDHVMREEAPFPISAIATPSDIDMLGTPAGNGARLETEEGSDVAEEEDGLFAGGDDEEEESDGMEEVRTTLGETSTNGMKRKLVEEDDYD
jgi:transcription initiation factor TFIID subunit 9B